jgi:hypothetical protein
MTITIHRCAECNHQAEDHSTDGWVDGHPPRVGPCSQGGCACRLNKRDVIAANPPVEIPTFPARPLHTTPA